MFFRTRRRLILVVSLILVLGASDAAASPATPLAVQAPWRIAAFLDLPARLSITAQHRSRYERLDDQFRAARKGDDEVVALRTLIQVGLQLTAGLSMHIEMMDSRVYLDDRFTPLNTTQVNTFELLQAYGQFVSAGPSGGSSVLRLGRITMDVGSRRFIARNRYRNTINAFTGFDWEWQTKTGHRVRVFYVLPIQRRPRRFAELRRNDYQIDKESFDVQFWGAHFDANLPGDYRGEIFAFGLYEKDGLDRPTRNRRIATAGFRLVREPANGQIDYQVELALQFGKSRSSTSPADTRDLDHFAHFEHVELGYTFDLSWSPRAVLQYDYASGDDDPNDGKNERFQTLYGARRFDFGPTGIYGPFARSNINTPGVRFQLKPGKGVTAFVAYRAFWLASKRDAWTTSGLRDPAGNSGSFIANQVEVRVRWDIFPRNVRIEAGVALLFAGEFMDDAPNSNGQGDATYAYSQVVFEL